ncbi:hypothetical protein EYF80_060550 [Liparis tanakae]|uniref:Uncharacterized protein n=1 Tax=Liparis tanakae TaxID=230148 RepID=A0A4Z2EKG7_9TELE|nr:hypothetical protein EYF80_060550 [Liparis tanakae]
MINTQTPRKLNPHLVYRDGHVVKSLQNNSSNIFTVTPTEEEEEEEEEDKDPLWRNRLCSVQQTAIVSLKLLLLGTGSSSRGGRTPSDDKGTFDLRSARINTEENRLFCSARIKQQRNGTNVEQPGPPGAGDRGPGTGDREALEPGTTKREV